MMKTSIFWKEEGKALLLIIVTFLICFYLPVETIQNNQRLTNGVWEALYLVRWYAQEHVLLCLIPAFFIAGAIGVFISQDSVLKYLGAKANPILAYGVASISGTILAVCSCTVLPLFAGIYRMGAGLGPAIAFLYSGPAINILAIILTAKILGIKLGIARAIGAIVFSVIIGLIMAFIFRQEELEKIEALQNTEEIEVNRPLWQNALICGAMVIILVLANWAKPDASVGIWFTIYSWKWLLTGLASLLLAIMLVLWLEIKPSKMLLIVGVVGVLAWRFPTQPLIPFAMGVVGLSWLTMTTKGEARQWFEASWDFAKQIFPLLLLGVLVAGLLLGRPGHEALIPSAWIANAVGGNSLFANFFAAFAGAFMYFATLTEVPILQGLIGNGMGSGPALALLLAGPALSLPNMLVIKSVIGLKKTACFVGLVVLMATFTGWVYGSLGL